MGGELEFTNSWRAGIEVGVCRCKSCIIRVKVSSWVVKPRTHGHCVPLTLSLKAQNPNETLPFSKLQTCNSGNGKSSWSYPLLTKTSFILFVNKSTFNQKSHCQKPQFLVQKFNFYIPNWTELDFWKRQKGFQNWLFTLSEITIFASNKSGKKVNLIFGTQIDKKFWILIWKKK